MPTIAVAKVVLKMFAHCQLQVDLRRRGCRPIVFTGGDEQQSSCVTR